MRSTLARVAAFATTALAHYNFEALIVNDNITDPYAYVRQTSNANSPITDVTSQDFVCNAGGLDAATMAKTATHTVQAGDSVGFTINSEIGHPGPLHVYMSKAPDTTTAAAYDGSGDWFKVYSLTTSSITADGLQWATYVDGGIKNFTFALPKELASGEYLMRAEHIGLHGAGSKGGAQFYMGCAQLKVEGTGTGAPTETVKIPGVYDGSEPGNLINIYYPVPLNYTDPGPATWPNACEDSTANSAGQTSDGDCTGSTAGSSTSVAGTATGTGSASSPATTPDNSVPTTPTTTTPSSAPAVSSAADDTDSAAGSAATGAASPPVAGNSAADKCRNKKRKRAAKKHGAISKRAKAAPRPQGLAVSRA